MKKLLSVILIVLLAFSLTACSALSDLSSSENKTSRGIISGNTYTSDFTDISLTLPSDWEFSSDEEIAEMAGLATDAIGVDEFSQTLMNNASVYDMMAKNTTTQENIIIVYENTIKTGGTQISAEEYLDIVSKQLPASMGYTISEEGNVTLCGNTYLKAVFSTEYTGVALSQTYFLRNMGDYVVSIVMTSTGYTSPDTMEGFFN